MANILLAQRGTTPIQLVGEKWVYNFINRQEQLKTRYTRRYNYRRAKCEDSKAIREWFNRVQITIMQYRIAIEDIYNFDETGFAIGLVATARVVTRADYYGKASFIQLGNRE
ncbi:Pogo transposable element [Aspergillus sclerotialis]|uniref:Pogo transposable element n=1 Tax=Aspergillus sclerotialis TaxID=2070753 RepID=A0A3A2Z2L1_9EURO|nr:Pogo transposable element [Aspergillus sclerotialis]